MTSTRVVKFGLASEVSSNNSELPSMGTVILHDPLVKVERLAQAAHLTGGSQCCLPAEKADISAGLGFPGVKMC